MLTISKNNIDYIFICIILLFSTSANIYLSGIPGCILLFACTLSFQFIQERKILISSKFALFIGLLSVYFGLLSFLPSPVRVLQIHLLFHLFVCSICHHTDCFGQTFVLPRDSHNHVRLHKRVFLFMATCQSSKSVLYRQTDRHTIPGCPCLIRISVCLQHTCLLDQFPARRIVYPELRIIFRTRITCLYSLLGIGPEHHEKQSEIRETFFPAHMRIADNFLNNRFHYLSIHSDGGGIQPVKKVLLSVSSPTHPDPSTFFVF